MSIGPCIPCHVGNHDDCVGAIASTGCTCRDDNHGEDTPDTFVQQALL